MKTTSQTKLYMGISNCNSTLIQKLEDNKEITIISKKKIWNLETFNAIKVRARYRDRELIFNVGYDSAIGHLEVRFFYEFLLQLMNPPKQKLIISNYLHPTSDTWIEGKYVHFLYEWIYNHDPFSKDNYELICGRVLSKKDKKEKINFDSIKDRNIVAELEYLHSIAVQIDSGEFNKK